MHFRIRCSVSENELRTPSTSIYLMYFGIKVVTYIIQLSNMNLYISLSYTNEIIFANLPFFRRQKTLALNLRR